MTKSRKIKKNEETTNQMENRVPKIACRYKSTGKKSLGRLWKRYAFEDDMEEVYLLITVLKVNIWNILMPWFDYDNYFKISVSPVSIQQFQDKKKLIQICKVWTILP